MKTAIILGTRPEIIKMAPIIKEFEKLKSPFFLIHTNQHYTKYMDAVFFKKLKLKKPKYNLNVGSCKPGKQTGKMIEGIEKVLEKEKPELVLVEGDTNTVLAGAIAATKNNIKVGHVEAGLRSFDQTMPEEKNRILTDHISDYLFAPTEESKKNLLNEGIDSKKIFITGNTIVDAIKQNINRADKKILKKLSIKEKKYFLVTIHRQENTDNKKRLFNILKGLKFIGQEFDQKIIYPIHPRTKKMVKKFGLKIPKEVITINPVGYFDFLALEQSALEILTDSGGVQEEACILKVPCVTIRDNTERPETLRVGSNVIAGTNPKKILQMAKKMLLVKKNWKNPFGENAAEKIVKKCY